MTLLGSGHKHSMYMVPLTELEKNWSSHKFESENQKFSEGPIKLEMVIGLRTPKFRISDREVNVSRSKE